MPSINEPKMGKPEILRLADSIIDLTDQSHSIAEELENRLSAVTRREPEPDVKDACRERADTTLGEQLHCGTDSLSHLNHRLRRLLELLEV